MSKWERSAVLGISIVSIIAVLFMLLRENLRAQPVMAKAQCEKELDKRVYKPDTVHGGIDTLLTAWWGEDGIPEAEVVFYHDGYLVFEKPGVRDTVNLWDLFAIKTRVDSLEAMLEIWKWDKGRHKGIDPVGPQQHWEIGVSSRLAYLELMLERAHIVEVVPGLLFHPSYEISFEPVDSIEGK